MKLNLGCGKDVRKGYLNVDVISYPGIDKILDITKKLPFGEKVCEEIVLQDVLEHLMEKDQIKMLNELWRVLKPNGRVLVRTPNIDAIWEKFDHPEVRNLYLYGDSENQGIWGVHKTGHSLESIGTLFRMCDFKIVKWKEVETNWVFELRKEKSTGVGFVYQIHKPVTKNYWFYRWLSMWVSEFYVPDKLVYDSLFPKTRIPITRVKINQLEFQRKRAYARQLAKIDLGI